MSSTVRNMKRQLGKKAEPKKKKKKISWVAVTNLVLIVIAVIVIAITYGSLIKEKVYGITLKNACNFTDWEKLDNMGEVNIYLSQEDYFYDMDKFIEVYKSRALNTLETMNTDGLLTEEVYKYLKDGIDSQYFENCTMISYEDYQEEATKFIEVCNKLNSMDVDDCCEELECEDGCIFKEYLEAYINEEYRDNLETAHIHYHELLESKEATYELGEDELQYYYEIDLVNNMDNIEEIEVELTYLPASTMELSDTAFNWLLLSDKAAKYRKTKTLTLKDAEAIQYLGILSDATMYDDAILDRVTNILYQMGDTIENDSESNLVVFDITGIEDYESYIDEKLKEENSVRNMKNSRRQFVISISDMYNGEQIYVMFDVTKCKHKDNIPSMEEYVTDEWKADLVHNILQDSLWSSLYSEE